MADGPHGALLASCGADGVKFWDVIPDNDGVRVRQTSVFRPPAAIKCIRWHPNNQFLAAASALGRVYLVSPQGQLIHTLDCPGKEIVSVSFSSRALAVSSGRTILVYTLTDNALTHTFARHTDTVTAVAFNADGSHILSGGSSGELFLHNVNHGATVSPLSAAGHGGVTAIQYSLQKPSYAGTGHQDGAFMVWDVIGRRVLNTFQQHTGPTTGVAFSTVHAALAVTVGADRRVVFYDVLQLTVIKFVTTASPLAALSFMEDGSTIALGTATGSLVVLDMKRSETDETMVAGRQDAAHPAGPVASVAFQLPANLSARRSSSRASDARSAATSPVDTPTGTPRSTRDRKSVV